MLLRTKAPRANLFDDKPANVVTDEDEWSSRVVKSVLHEKSKKAITMLDESGVFVIHREAVIVGEEHDATTLPKAAGKDIPGPHLATVGPGVSVDIVIGLNIETMYNDDAKDGQRSKRDSVTAAEGQDWNATQFNHLRTLPLSVDRVPQRSHFEETRFRDRIAPCVLKIS